MARYIDAELLKEVVLGWEPPLDNKQLEHEIDTMPTADVAEVKHGEWVSLTECSNAGVYCSVCHKKVYKEDYAWCNKRNKLRSNYCPNCGAHMKAGKEEC